DGGEIAAALVLAQRTNQNRIRQRRHQALATASTIRTNFRIYTDLTGRANGTLSMSGKASCAILKCDPPPRGGEQRNPYSAQTASMSRMRQSAAGLARIASRRLLIPPSRRRRSGQVENLAGEQGPLQRKSFVAPQPAGAG